METATVNTGYNCLICPLYKWNIKRVQYWVLFFSFDSLRAIGIHKKWKKCDNLFMCTSWNRKWSLASQGTFIFLVSCGKNRKVILFVAKLATKLEIHTSISFNMASNKKHIKHWRITTYYSSKWTDNRLIRFAIDGTISRRALNSSETNLLCLVHEEQGIWGGSDYIGWWFLCCWKIHTSHGRLPPRRSLLCRGNGPESQTEKSKWRLPVSLLVLFSLWWMCKQGI